MADNKKTTKKKSNSSSKKTTQKKTTSTAAKNKKKTTKKTSSTSAKKNQTNKKTTTKAKQTTKKVNKEKEAKVVVEQVVVEEKKEELKKESKPSKVDNKNNNTKQFDIKNSYRKFVKRFKSLSTLSRTLIIVSVVCGLLLIIEGVLVLQHRSFIERHTVYHETYSGVAIDNNDVLVSGSTDVKGGLIHSKDNERGKLVKYDNNGNIVFEKVYKRGISTTFTSVTNLSDGYLVTGTGIFSEKEQKEEGKEAFVIKYDKDGKIIWQKFYQVLTDTSFNKAIVVSDGYVVVGQSIYANMEMGNHTTGGGIIVKYDFDGNEVWHNNHGGTKSGNFNDIVEVNGSFYVVGKDGADSANLVKFNAKGEYEWHKNYSYTDNVGFTGIAFENNSLYVVGSKKVLPEETTDKDNRDTKNTDALLINYDLNGNIVFEKTYGGSSYERYNSIIAYHNNFYVVGHICSKDAGFKITTDKEEEMTGFIIRYDINGNILKKEVLGGSNDDNLVDIATDGVSYYVVGYSNSKDGNIRGSHSNGKDFYGKLIKLNSKFKSIFIK